MTLVRVKLENGFFKPILGLNGIKKIGSSSVKLNGWSTPMLICVYRAYCLSHLTYSAVMLISTSAAAKCEMNTFNSRLWRIMGIDDQTAGSYKLLPIAEFIDHVCEQTLNRILADSNHPITSCQPRNLRLNARLPFQTRKANKAAYHNSFLQKFLRKLRNDSNSQNKYINQKNLYEIKILKDDCLMIL
ncbi:hypothetical protein BpHYR1_042547 [Brachionus plicatilis]|uniref:RNA-directed DNA polymerase from mobile element jockey-like n=1 Tax=Brachionus plicatilis TaxID=10195 RepID=A0A3M7Q4V4_BRAPC|nr:hypothetical protein BpHYR1_042547 [Brachionus plicatilis]